MRTGNYSHLPFHKLLIELESYDSPMSASEKSRRDRPEHCTSVLPNDTSPESSIGETLQPGRGSYMERGVRTAIGCITDIGCISDIL